MDRLVEDGDDEGEVGNPVEELPFEDVDEILLPIPPPPRLEAPPADMSIANMGDSSRSSPGSIKEVLDDKGVDVTGGGGGEVLLEAVDLFSRSAAGFGMLRTLVMGFGFNGRLTAAAGRGCPPPAPNDSLVRSPKGCPQELGRVDKLMADMSGAGLRPLAFSGLFSSLALLLTLLFWLPLVLFRRV